MANSREKTKSGNEARQATTCAKLLSSTARRVKASMYCGAALKPASVERLDVCAAKYARLRRLTRDLLEEQALPVFRTRVTVQPVDDSALDVVDMDWTPSGRRIPFAWRERILPVLHKSHPRRLDLAVWCNGQLCGLAVARLSNAKEWVSITHIEGSPHASHPLKGRIAQIVLVGADIYASLVQPDGRKPQVRIMNPLPQSMVAYERSGYSAVTKANGYWYATCRNGGTP